jgi:hypothetical protein
MINNKIEKMENIIFDINKFKRFRKFYNKAVIENRDTFLFEEKEILTTYAKYMIEYLNKKFEGG